MQLNSAAFELSKLMEGISSTMNVIATGKNLLFSIETDQNVPDLLFGDELRLRQILLNLAGNGIKFTNQGSVRIHVAAKEVSGSPNAVLLHFSVQDTGIGIAADKLTTIFQSFEQVDNSFTRQYGGTGLGLVISKQLTRLMGGDIGFYDNVQENISNQGATFWFRMPAHVDPTRLGCVCLR